MSDPKKPKKSHPVRPFTQEDAAILALCGAVEFFQRTFATREVVNPLCGDLYNHYQNLLSVSLTDAATAAASAMATMEAKAAWEDCENNGPLVGMPDDTMDGGDGVDTVPDATDPTTDMGME